MNPRQHAEPEAEPQEPEHREPRETPDLAVVLPHVSPSAVSEQNTDASHFSASLAALHQQSTYQQQTIEAVAALVAQQGKALEVVTQEMRATLEEMRDTMELAQKALLDADSVTEKLGVGLAALATLEAKWEALYEIEESDEQIQAGDQGEE